MTREEDEEEHRRNPNTLNLQAMHDAEEKGTFSEGLRSRDLLASPPRAGKFTKGSSLRQEYQVDLESQDSLSRHSSLELLKPSYPDRGQAQYNGANPSPLTSHNLAVHTALQRQKSMQAKLGAFRSPIA